MSASDYDESYLPVRTRIWDESLNLISDSDDVNPYDDGTPEWGMFERGEGGWPGEPPQFPRY